MPFLLSSQNRLNYLNHSFDLKIDQAIIQKGGIHSSFQPLSEMDLQRLDQDLDSLIPLFSVAKKQDLRGWKRKLFHEHLFILDTQEVQLTLDPIYYFEYTHQLDEEDNPFFKNGRGFLLQLQVSDYLAVGSSFLENQAKLPDYISNRIEATDAAYGQGRVKRIDTSFYDFAMSSAYLTYRPWDFMDLTIGHGKHFIGNGYRSHLLSDLAFNYPYLKLRTNWWDGRIQYQNIYGLYQDLVRVNTQTLTEDLFERKFAATHYLSIMPHPKLEIGFFESNLWASIDSSGRQEPPLSAYAPVIFLNSLVADKKDVLAANLGLNIAYSPFEKLQLYTQLSSLDTDEGLSSYQLGFTYFLIENLRVGVEFNAIEDSSFTYAHYNESLSLPYAGKQEEIVLSAQYMYQRWNILARANLFSGDVDQAFVLGELSYMLNPSVNSNFFISTRYREINSELFFSFGWRTSLQNLYFNY